MSGNAPRSASAVGDLQIAMQALQGGLTAPPGYSNRHYCNRKLVVAETYQKKSEVCRPPGQTPYDSRIWVLYSIELGSPSSPLRILRHEVSYFDTRPSFRQSGVVTAGYRHEAMDPPPEGELHFRCSICTWSVQYDAHVCRQSVESRIIKAILT